ncbi:MAG: hypothetical protein U5K30_01830 [Acidimicrobiales bacterium]|nr:hypothetical protein [Acidimicrobiales bacterium]
MSNSPSAGRRGAGASRPAEVLDQQLGRQIDHAVGRAQHVGHAGLQRAEVDPVGMVLEHVEA